MLHNEFIDMWLSLGDAVVVTDKDHKIIAINDQYAKICGFPKDELINKQAGYIKSGLTPATVYKQMKETLDVYRTWNGVITNKRKNGEVWNSHLSITPFNLNNTVYYVGTARDLSSIEGGHFLTLVEEQQLQRNILFSLAVASEYRDKNIQLHLSRVQYFTELLINCYEEEYGKLDKVYKEHIISGSVLHDIGKSAIPDSILYKPARLTDEEMNIMKTHVDTGENLIHLIFKDISSSFRWQLKEINIARNIVLYHHEKWDGSGYGKGIFGEEIPFEARIVAFADVFEALSAKRVYKDSWSFEEIKEYILSQSGKHFDPTIVNTFAKNIDLFDDSLKEINNLAM